MVSRLLKTSKMTARPDLAVFPLLSKLPNIKNTNPFSKKDTAAATAATAAAAAATTDANAEESKPEEAEKNGDEKAAQAPDSGADGTKVRLVSLTVSIERYSMYRPYRSFQSPTANSSLDHHSSTRNYHSLRTLKSVILSQNKPTVQNAPPLRTCAT